MTRRYRYVGPRHIAARDLSSTPRVLVANSDAVRKWVGESGQVPDPDGCYTATYVVLDDGVWIADRRSEHVACARGEPVLAAGEIRFDDSAQLVEVVEVSNQSTGYCPAPGCWPAIAEALDRAGLSRPSGLTRCLDFRRCVRCGQLCVIKDQVYDCSSCGATLPNDWNCDVDVSGEEVNH